MADAQVTCVIRIGQTHESITHLGGLEGGGWRLTKQEVIDTIRNGSNTFYTMVGGKRANVHVVDANPPYVQTAADGYYNNNLLALPICK